MVFVLTNWMAPPSGHPGGGGGVGTNRGYRGLLVAIYLAHTLALCYCQRGADNNERRNSNLEVSPGLIAGIVSIVVLLALLLSMCFLCKRCKGKKQKERDRRKRMYAITGSRPTSGRPISAISQGRPLTDISQARPQSSLSIPSRPSTGVSRGRPMSAVSGSRPNSAVSSISTISSPRLAKPRVAHVVNDIEVIDEDNTSDSPEEHPPSPFSPMDL